MRPKHSHDAPESVECDSLHILSRFTPALIEIGDSKAAHQARCDWCGKFIGSTNPAKIVDVHSPDYWNGVDEKLLCKRCSDNSEG